MTINEAFHVPHAAVTDFDGVSTEYFMQDVAFGEMHVDQLQEFFGPHLFVQIHCKEG